MWHDIVLLHGVIIIWICIHDCRCTSMWCILWWHKKPKHVCQRIYEWCTHTCICMYICDWDTWIHICLYIPIHTYNNMYHTIWLSMTEHMTYDMTTCYMSWLSIWGMKYMKYIMVLIMVLWHCKCGTHTALCVSLTYMWLQDCMPWSYVVSSYYSLTMLSTITIIWRYTCAHIYMGWGIYALVMST